MQHLKKIAVAATAAAAAATAVSLAVPAHAARHATPTPTVADYVTNLYHEFLNRAPSPGELTYWEGVDAQKGNGPVANGIILSTESASYYATEAYQVLLGRTPSAGEVQGRAAQIQQDRGLDGIFANVISSPEFFALAVDHPSDGTACGTDSAALRSHAKSGHAARAVAPHATTTTTATTTDVPTATATVTTTTTATTTVTTTATTTATTTVTASPTTSPIESNESLTDRWLDYAYCFSLERNPDQGGRASWDAVLGADSTAATRNAVELAILRSTEGLGVQVVGVYRLGLDRDPESAAALQAGINDLKNVFGYGDLAYLSAVIATPEGFQYWGTPQD